MLQWYARNHTLACVVPALFIAGAITTFLSKEAVLRHSGAARRTRWRPTRWRRWRGRCLAVCSCSVLPMFAGIYRVGAGLGPAATFLYAGPAINILAVFLTARVLGFELGVARAVGAMVFGVIIGLIMALLFRNGRSKRARLPICSCPTHRPRAAQPAANPTLLLRLDELPNLQRLVSPPVTSWCGAAMGRRRCTRCCFQETRDELLVQVDLPVAGLKVGDKLTLPKAELDKVEEADTWVMTVYHRQVVSRRFDGLAVLLMARFWFERWRTARVDAADSWDFAKMLVPLLFGGVFVVGFLGALLPGEQGGGPGGRQQPVSRT